MEVTWSSYRRTFSPGSSRFSFREPAAPAPSALLPSKEEWNASCAIGWNGLQRWLDRSMRASTRSIALPSVKAVTSRASKCGPASLNLGFGPSGSVGIIGAPETPRIASGGRSKEALDGAQQREAAASTTGGNQDDDKRRGRSRTRKGSARTRPGGTGGRLR